MINTPHTIQRCPHDKENPYAQINRDLIRDESLSPECRWMLIYLLSMKDGWVISPKQIVNHLKGKMGRDRVYRMINEGIEAGYILKEISIIGNLRQTVTYFVSETPKFKKILRHPEPQDTEAWDAECKDYKKETWSKQDHLDIVKDNVLEPPEIPKPKVKKDNAKTMTRSKDQDKTLNAQRRWKLTEEQYENFLYMKDQGVDSDDGTLAHWAKTYPFERIFDVLGAAKINRATSIGAYMNKLFKTDAIVQNSQLNANKQFAEDYKQQFGWHQLKICEKYCYFEFGRDKVEMPFNLNVEDFMNRLIDKHEVFKGENE